MGKICKACILFSFILFLVTPFFVFGEEALEEVAESDEVLTAIEGLEEGVITGAVVSLDTALGTITVKSEDGTEKTFSVVDGETILWKGIDDIELASIKEGDRAEVGYYSDESGKLIASWVDVLVEEESAISSEAEAQGEAKDNVIESVEEGLEGNEKASTIEE